MPIEVVFPKVDMDSDSGRIARWVARDGDAVKRGQVLFEIESDKAAVEVDAPADGILGDVADTDSPKTVGQPVAWIYADGEARDQNSRGETVATRKAVATQHAPDLAASSMADPASQATASEPVNGRVFATPLARRLAREAQLDLSTMQGSGARGRIQKKDVLDRLAGEMPMARNERGMQAQAVSSPLNHAWLRQGDGAPVVLLHGFGADLNGWRPMLAGIPFEHPLLSIDLPGHGLSSKAVPDSLDHISELVEGTLAAAGIGPLLLVGHSFGAAVAATIAARGVADVRALALAAPAGLGAEINGAFLQGLVRGRSHASLLPWIQQLVTDPDALPRGFVEATVKQSQDTELRAAQQWIAERFFADGTQTFDIRASLGSLRMPVRVIFGSNDRIIPAAHARGLPGEIAVHVFGGCGHLPQIERREQFVRILAEMHRAMV